MMQSLAQVGFQQSYTYSRGATRSSSSKPTFTRSRTRRVVFRPTSSSHPRYPHRVPAVRRSGRLQGARRDCATVSPSWASTPATSSSRTWHDRQRREHRQREVRVQAARLGDAEKAGLFARPIPHQTQPHSRRAPALRQLRNLDVHWSDDDAILSTRSTCPRLHERFSTSNHRGRECHPHSVRETMVHLDESRFGVTQA